MKAWYRGILAASLCVAFLEGLHAQTSSFTHSGVLMGNGIPANGLFDMEVVLHSTETGDNPVGDPNTVTLSSVPITDGLFTVTLDFGADVFEGELMWLEFGVGPAGSLESSAASRGPRGPGGPTRALAPLLPRGPMRAIPQATFARRARTAVEADTAGMADIADGLSPGASVDASQLASGQVPDARLSPNVALLGSSPFFSGGITTGVDFASAGSISFRPPDGFAYFHLDNGPSGGRPIGRLRFSYGVNPGDFEVMCFTQEKRVGIGSSSPSHTLAVSNTTDEETMRLIGPDVLGSGARLNFGDGDFVYFDEYLDDALRIQANLLGIGRDAATNRLEVEGNASKTAVGDWLANSDRRIKTSIREIDGTDALEKLGAVRPVAFEYTPEYRAAHPSIDDRTYMGVIAQEFAAVFPDWVKTSGERLPGAAAGDPASAILQVDPWPLTIHSAAAIKALNEQVRSLEERNAALKRDCAALNERLCRLEELTNAAP